MKKYASLTLSALLILTMSVFAGLPPIDAHIRGDSQLGDAGSDLSDPINLSTGEYVLNQTDLHIPGRGLDFEITRTYRSYYGLALTEFGLGGDDWVHVDPENEIHNGDNWDFNYNIRLSYVMPEPGPNWSGQEGGPIPTDALLPPSFINVFPGTSRADEYSRYTSGDNAVDYYSSPFTNWRIEFTLVDEPVYITDENKTIYKFFPVYPANQADTALSGRLESITDRNGNKITFTWETYDFGVDIGDNEDYHGTGNPFSKSVYARIDYANDTLGHQIDFIYHDESVTGQTSGPATDVLNTGNDIAPFDNFELYQLIWMIKDHAGRVVEYDYEKRYSTDVVQLLSATLPAVENDSAGHFPLPTEHERFPSGRKWQYAYQEEPLLEKWDDLMLSTITSPNGDVVLENEYDVSPTDGWLEGNDRNDGRVLRQVYGDGVYNYVVTTLAGGTDLPGGDGSSSTHELYAVQDDYYVWVNDRRGAVTRLKYAGQANTTYKHRQLLERVEYDGLFDDKDASIFGTVDESTGEVTAWNKLDTSDYYHNSTVIPATEGPLRPDGTQTTQKFVYSWETNATWHPTACYAPGGNSTSLNDRVTYSRIDEFDTEDPRSWGSIKSKVQHSVSYDPGTITEQWAYGFDTTGDGGWGKGFETGYKDGAGNVTIKEYDEEVNLTTNRANGDLLAVYEGLSNPDIYANPLLLSTSNTTAISRYEYNDWGQVVKYTHPESTRLDTSGNEVPHTRIDEFEYYNDPTDEENNGRLFKKRTDSTGFNLTTVYEYDMIGNVIKETHSNGDVSEYLHNQANDLVREQHYDDAQVLYAQTDYFYDANRNTVREEVMNLAGDPPVLQANVSITTVHEFDIHGYQTRMSQEHGNFSGSIMENTATGIATAPVSDWKFATQQWDYDEAKNIIEYSNGQAVNQSVDQQTSNIVSYQYDARDQMIKREQGEGNGAGDTLVTTAEYDDKGRPETIYIAQGKLNDQNEPIEQKYSIQFDGFDRISHIDDPMGNRLFYEYDGHDNLTESHVGGPVGFDLNPLGGTFETRYTLYSESFEYDELNRLTQRALDIFDYDYGTSSGPAEGAGPHGLDQQITGYTYNADSSLRTITETSGDIAQDMQTKFYYDTASRLEFVRDHDLNETKYEYDSASNVTKQTRKTQPTLTTSSVQIFEVDQLFDALDRLVSMTDGSGNVRSIQYDSRDNPYWIIDPRGNLTLYTYDGMNRLTKKETQMTATGMGTGAYLGVNADFIVNQMKYDDSSRLIEDIDDAGNVTRYAYDGLNRAISTTMPDNAVYASTYDANGNLAVHTDARGVVISHLYDRNNRLTSRSVDGVEIETYLYDGLGRVRGATNNFAFITREYDSRSNVIREIQNVDAASSFDPMHDQIVEYSYDTANNNEQIQYPNGRVIDRSFDSLNRMLSISDPTMLNSISQFDYIGFRLERRTHGNDTQTGYDYNGYQGALIEAGDHGFGQLNKINTAYIDPNTSVSTVLDSFTFTWDESQNRKAYRDTGSDMDNRRERSFGYDSADRLVSSGVTYPDVNTTKLDDTTNYLLDDDHNRINVAESAQTGDGGAGAGLGSYELNSTQAQNNQYSITPRESGSEWVYQYDANGNMTLMAVNVIADFDNNYSLDFFDVSEFLAAHGNQDPDTDINGDGQFDFFDVTAFLGVFNAYGSGSTLENRHYTYDFRNQLTGIKYYDGPSVITYEMDSTYDPFARRVTETVDNNAITEVQFVYGGESLWQVLEQIDLINDQTLSTHVFGLGIDDEVAYRLEQRTAPNKDIWAHRDDLGSLTSITNSDGTVIERYEYGDFGLVTFLDANGVDQGLSMHGAFHLYTGRSIIPGSGLFDLRFRLMDPLTGKFFQRDPLGTYDSINIYTYVRINPYGFTDPFGLASTYGPESISFEMEAPWGPVRIRKPMKVTVEMDFMRDPCMKNFPDIYGPHFFSHNDKEETDSIGISAIVDFTLLSASEEAFIRHKTQLDSETGDVVVTIYVTPIRTTHGPKLGIGSNFGVGVGVVDVTFDAGYGSVETGSLWTDTDYGETVGATVTIPGDGGDPTIDIDDHPDYDDDLLPDW